MSEWISIAEKIPHLAEFVLFCGIGEKFIYTQFGVFLGKIENKSGIWFGAPDREGNFKLYNEITHWMLPPEPPKYRIENVKSHLDAWDRQSKAIEDGCKK